MSIVDRVKGAVLLDGETYELIEENKRYLPEAAGIVAITSLLTGVGAALSGKGVEGFVSMLVVGFVLWFIWAAAALFVGTKYFEGTSNMGEMLRVLGYASIPMVLGVIPFFGMAVGGLWTLAASVVAIKRGMDFSMSKAVMTAGAGWVIFMVVRYVLFFIF